MGPGRSAKTCDVNKYLRKMLPFQQFKLRSSVHAQHQFKYTRGKWTHLDTYTPIETDASGLSDRNRNKDDLHTVQDENTCKIGFLSFILRSG
jgi:hypothetical protein